MHILENIRIKYRTLLSAAAIISAMSCTAYAMNDDGSKPMTRAKPIPLSKHLVNTTGKELNEETKALYESIENVEEFVQRTTAVKAETDDANGPKIGTLTILSKDCWLQVTKFLSGESLDALSKVDKHGAVIVDEELRIRVSRLAVACGDYSKRFLDNPIGTTVPVEFMNAPFALFMMNTRIYPHAPTEPLTELVGSVKTMLSLPKLLEEKKTFLGIQATQFILAQHRLKNEAHNLFPTTSFKNCYIERSVDISAEMGMAPAPVIFTYLKPEVADCLEDVCQQALQEDPEKKNRLNDLCYSLMVDINMSKYPCTRADVRKAAGYLLKIQDHRYYDGIGVFSYLYQKPLEGLLRGAREKIDGMMYGSPGENKSIPLCEVVKRTHAEKVEDFNLLREVYKYARTNLAFNVLQGNTMGDFLRPLKPEMKSDKQALIFIDRYLDEHFKDEEGIK